LDRTCGAVGINLSVTALADPEVLRFLAALPVSRVVVELTEHEAVADYDALSAALAPLRRRGMSLAVDDAGAGFASLRHVLRLAPDWIKVDQTIVRSADTDPARAALLEALVVFARGAGMQVLAEGVETAGEAALVRRLGMHSAQGWYFGHPSFPDELPEVGPVLAAAEITRLALPRPRASRDALAEPLAG
jgi:EAL domain-containing protein (putative c-di-GMP-specific phosphodiesterase class I)